MARATSGMRVAFLRRMTEDILAVRLFLSVRLARGEVELQLHLGRSGGPHEPADLGEGSGVVNRTWLEVAFRTPHAQRPASSSYGVPGSSRVTSTTMTMTPGATRGS